MKDQADFIEFDFQDLFPSLLQDKETRFIVDPDGETSDTSPDEMPGYTTLTLVFTNHDPKGTTAETVVIDDVEDLEGDTGVRITGTEFSGVPVTITVEYNRKEKE